MEVNTSGILCVFSFCLQAHKIFFYVNRIMRQHVHQHAIKSEHVAINQSNKHRESHILHIVSIRIMAKENVVRVYAII